MPGKAFDLLAGWRCHTGIPVVPSPAHDSTTSYEFHGQLRGVDL